MSHRGRLDQLSAPAGAAPVLRVGALVKKSSPRRAKVEQKMKFVSKGEIFIFYFLLTSEFTTFP